jgi:hypothetical protein
MRSKPKRKKEISSVPKFSSIVRNLSKRSYSSEEEYHEVLSNALKALANASEKLARAESSYFSKSKERSNHKNRTLEVYPSDDSTGDYSRIQQAIDNAAPGDRVLLKSGVFRSSGTIWVWKDLTIEGEMGSTIQGTTHHHGKVIADPQTNGGFILLGNPFVEIKNLHFKNLYFAAASNDNHELDHLVFENNVCEDVYHSVYISGKGSELTARNNKVLVTSLKNSSTRCRFNYYEESHVFGFYCNKNSSAVIENNVLEVRELTDSQPFHAVAVFCSGEKSFLINNNFKGWHSSIVVDNSQAFIHDNRIHGVCSDSQFQGIGISLQNCSQPSVSSNQLISRNLGSGAIGISASDTKKGRIINNEIDLSEGENSIMLHKSDHFLVGGNKLNSPIAIFGQQSRDVSGNVVFDNVVDHTIELKMNYASGNTFIGSKRKKIDDKDNLVLAGHVYEEISDAGVEQNSKARQQRIFDHINRKIWPNVPDYLG